MIPASDRADTFWSTRENQVTLSELLVLGDVCDHGWNIEDQLVSVRLLASLPIDLQLDLDVARVSNRAFVHVLRNSCELISAFGSAPISTSFLLNTLQHPVGEV